MNIPQVRLSSLAHGGVRWLLVALFLALLIASAWITFRSWQQDPAQQTGSHLATWLMRVMIGAMWFQGSLWKLPLPVSGGFRFWTGKIAEGAAFEFDRSPRMSSFRCCRSSIRSCS